VERISFAGDGLAPDLVPSAELADCAATALASDGKRILSYGTGAGYTPLRELIAEQFGVHPFRVLLTNGWLQGFMLLAAERVRGQSIVVEYPTYDRVVQALFKSGSSLVYADLNDAGMDLDNLEYVLRTMQTPPLAYLTPSFQNPSGQTLSFEQRVRLCTLLVRRGTLIVEDDSYGLLRFEGEMVPTLFEITGQRSVYSTSFSATIAPGLRVGVFILPNDLAGELAATANATYISPVLLAQATVFEFMRRESFEPNLEGLREQLRLRRDALVTALEKHISGASWSKPEGGIFMLLRLPPGTDAKGLLESAAGVTATAGADFGGLPNTIRLNYAAPALDEIEPGIERLAAALSLTLNGP
jgi:2-aminoadipate transaminase